MDSEGDGALHMNRFSKPEVLLKKSSRKLTWRQGRLNGSSCIVSLQIHSAQGKALLQKIGNNWPEDSWNCFHDSGYNSLESSLRKSPIQKNSESLSSKKRNSKTQTTSSLTISPRIRQQPDCTVQSVALDLTGYPEARGCRECFQIGERCPLLEPDAEYPCHVCAEQGYECELLVPPKRKNSCENCKSQSRLKCSYMLKNWGDHSQPCYQCASKKRRCVAGPALDILRRRLPKVVAINDFQVETEKSNPSSLQLEHQVVGAAQAQSNEIQRKDGCVGTADATAIIHSSRDEEMPVSTSTSVHQQKPKHISTKLAHPITFMYEPPANGARPCQWCAEPFYGLLGRDERIVEVDETHPGHYIEISGGHTKDGCEPSRVCIYHTQEVFRIVGCNGHELRRFRKGVPSAEEFEVAIDRLLKSKDGKNLSKRDRWCRLCPQLATWECSRPRARNPKSEVSVSQGCGLQLCNVCAVSLGQGFDNDLQRMLRDLQSKIHDKDFYPYGLRADVSFLQTNGPLVKSVLSCIRDGR